MRRELCFNLTIGLVGALFISPLYAKEASFELMMTGSELKFCRSTQLNQCNPESVTRFSKDITRQSKLYKLSMAQINKAMSADYWHSSRQVLRFELNIFLTEFAKKVGTSAMSYEQLINRWKSLTIGQGNNTYSGHTLFLRLNNDEHDMVFDFLEDAQSDGFGRGLKEHVNFDDTKFPNSRAQAKIIIEQSRLKNNRTTPNIILITAGSRDSFAEVDAYSAFFNSLGANTDWLPIDRALNTLLVDKAKCEKLDRYREKFLNSFQRENIYRDKTDLQQQYCTQPQKITQLIEQADGVVFIGDSPMLLRDSLIIHGRIISETLRLIKQRVKKNQLFVAALGSVSRAMVGDSNQQPVIIAGRGENVMAYGTDKFSSTNLYCQGAFVCQPKATIFSEGGIGLFDFSIIDTRFSKRGRFARLANVAMDSGHQFGLGIDQDTAVLVAQGESGLKLKVSGLAGVTLLQQDITVPKAKHHELNNLKISYFTTGDILTIIDQKIAVEYPNWKTKVTTFLNQPQDYKNLFFSDNFYRFAQQACLIDDKRWIGFAGRKKGYKLSLEKPRNAHLMMGGLKIDGGFKLYCSFHALNLDLTRR